MFIEEPKVEFVAIDFTESMLTTGSNCTEDQTSSQGGTSCIGNAEHSQGSGCDDTAPLIT